MFIVKRYINGIILNGFEFLLTPDRKEVWKFQSKAEAKRILTLNGENILALEIVPEIEPVCYKVEVRID